MEWELVVVLELQFSSCFSNWASWQRTAAAAPRGSLVHLVLVFVMRRRGCAFSLAQTFSSFGVVGVLSLPPVLRRLWVLFFSWFLAGVGVEVEWVKGEEEKVLLVWVVVPRRCTQPHRPPLPSTTVVVGF